MRVGWLAGFVALLTGGSCVTGKNVGRVPTVGLPLQWSVERCGSPSVDRDEDGIDDECELALARAFAPELVVDRSDCSWNGDWEPPRLEGGYLFAAQRSPSGRGVRLAYLPAYYRDCGWSGLACATRRRGCSAHAGDSELIVVQVQPDPRARRWFADAIFLSAHCFGRSGGRCRWYDGDDLLHFQWVDNVRGGAPRVWVAKGKHANYPSRAECDTGHWYYDSCDRNDAAYRFPITSIHQNIGSRRRPLPAGDAAGCINAPSPPPRSLSVDHRALECLWGSTTGFSGWQRTRRGYGATPYGRVLAAAGF
jgi:hypothetical protein